MTSRRSLPAERLAGVSWTVGLSRDEVGVRRLRWGANDIVESVGRPWRALARDTARDPMIWFLAGAASLYAVVGATTEAVTLVLAIVPLVVMDAFLHRRARASTEGLRGRLAERATVVRDGGEIAIPARDIVPGDLAVIAAGEPVPADGVLVSGDDIQADESILTGEAYPVRKRRLAAAPAAPVAAEHWAFAGTRLLTGRGRLRVVFTGGETIYGEIVRSAAGTDRDPTPLQGAIGRLVGVLVAAATVICLLLAGVRLLQGHGWLDAFLAAVTLASAALPEEFPVVFTFFLGVGVYRLAQRQALVRRAVAVENIGRVTTICSDKTGTMTEGRLRLTHLVAADTAREPELLRWAVVASRVEARDPIDVAITEADSAGRDGFSVDAVFPFTEARKREIAIARTAAGGRVAVVKGAVETVLAMSAGGDGDVWRRRADALAAEGHKVIACAWRALSPAAALDVEPTDGYRMAGLLAFEDPVRPGVADALAACRAAGIHTIMVTGDHPLTAGAVARDIGLAGGSPAVISGEELDARLAGGAATTLRGVDIVARATPAQKLALVRALRRCGEIVAVTGDGVNDVPALQAADIGVAMGERGTRSAREAAAIVLLDDNFRTIVRAIAEGRQLFANLRASFQYLLIVHAALVLTAVVVPLLGYPLLYLPLHVVWLELIIHPTALLAFQDRAGGDTRPASRSSGRAAPLFFSRREWMLMGAAGGLLAAFVMAGYVGSVLDGGVEHGRAMALATLAMGSAAAAAALTRLRTHAARVVVGVTVVTTPGLLQAPATARLLHVAPLHAGEWLVVVAGACVVALLSSWLARGASPRSCRPS
jgi:Ca2+-transporting ATPase